MTIEQCIIGVRALKDVPGLSEDDVMKLDLFLDDLAADVKAGKKFDPDAIYAQINEIKLDAIRRRVAVTKQAIKKKTVIARMSKAGKDAMAAFNRNFQKIVLSEIEVRTNRMKVEVEKSFRELSKKHKRGALSIAADADFQRVLMKAVIDGEPTGSKLVDELATKMRDMDVENHNARMATGEPIGKLEGHTWRKWDLNKLTTKMDDAIKFFRENLADKDGFPANMSDAEVKEFLEGVAQSLNYNNLRNLGTGSGSSRRMIHFTTSEAEIKAHELFGQNTFLENWVDGMQGAIRSRVMVEAYGPLWRDPRHGVKSMAWELSKTAQEAGQKKTPIVSSQADFERVFHGQFESGGPSPNPTIHLVSRTVAAMNNVRLLGKIPLYALTDLGTSAFNTGGFKSGGFSGMLKELAKLTTDFDGDLHAVVNSALSLADFEFAAIARTMPFDINDPIASRGASALHKSARGSQAGANLLGKVTLANALTKKMIQAHTSLYLTEFGRHAGKSLNDVAKVDKLLHKRITDAGISEQVWAAVTNPDNLTGNMIDFQKITDANASAKMSAFLNSESYYAVVRPDISTRSFLQQGNDLKGSVFGLAMQYRSFSIQMMKGPMLRAKQEGGYLGLTKLALPMLVAGMAVTQASRILDGKEPYEIDNPHLLFGGVDKSGMLGIMSGTVSYTADAISAGRALDFTDVAAGLAGPTFTTIGRTAFAGANVALADSYRKEQSAKVRFYSQLAQLTPGRNIWYVNAMYLNAVNSALEEVDYASMYRRRVNERKRMGLRYADLID
jgi:hypothetical protein